MTLWRRVGWYIVALVISVLGFGVLNARYAVMFPACIDCYAHIGVPFAYLDTGGFEGEGGLLWRGVVADLLLLLAAAFVLALVLPHVLTSGLEVVTVHNRARAGFTGQFSPISPLTGPKDSLL